MSNLVYQNYNNKCQGWTNPSSLIFGPQISGLSGYQSPAGSNTVVSIIGSNFVSYSSILFGTYNPTVYFINSNLLQFYIPSSLNSGVFPVQVYNGSIGSNILTYTIDNASGYWLLNSNGTITNSNNQGIITTWLSRGVPVTIDSTTYNIGNPYIVPTDVNWIICDTTLGNVYITLPIGTLYNGREIMMKRKGTNSVFTGSSIIVPLDSSAASNSIMNSASAPFNKTWVTLIYNAPNWITMQAS